jgi:hypothetical protein
MPQFARNPGQQNPWGGVTSPRQQPNAPTSQGIGGSNEATFQNQSLANIPNAGAIGGMNGAVGPGQSLMPDIPDYLGQAAGRFNNFQPTSLGETPDFSNMFGHYQSMYDQIGKGPQISMNDPISGQMQNQMLNSAIGGNANQRQSAMQDAVTRMGSRGFTSESPALQATNNRLGLNEALANTQARVDIPMRAARENADYRLGASQANLGQRNADFQNFATLENAQTNRLSPLLQSLVGLV